MRFRFTGSESICGNVRISTYGQLLDLDAATAHDCLLGHVGLLPDEDFQKLGFSDDELNQYADYDSHRQADPEFLEKKAASHRQASQLRVQYEKEAAEGNTFMAREKKAQPAASREREKPASQTPPPPLG